MTDKKETATKNDGMKLTLVISNIDELQNLLADATAKASELKTALDKISNFEVKVECK